MNIFQFLKGALVKMMKAFEPKHSYRISVLKKEKYDLRNISRSQVKLPPHCSVLSLTKYFTDGKNDYESQKEKEEYDW